MAWHALLALVGLLVCGQSARAQNRYDILARLLQPYGALFYSKSSTKALQADVVLQETSTPAGSLLNRPLRVSLQIPDRLRVETMGAGDRIIFCRQGQRIWIYPAALADRLIAAAGPPPPKPPAAIPDFRLPLRDNQIVLLAALFQVTNFQPVRDADNEPAWSLEFHPATELLQDPGPPPCTLTAIVRQKDYQLRQLSVQSPEWSGRLQVLSLRFLSALPRGTWAPAPAEAAGAKDIPPSLYGEALAKLSSINLEP